MNEAEITQYIINIFPDVETSTNFGYTFFFCGAERMLPFATLASADNDYDRVSHLDRSGVFRLNIGVGKQAFQSLFGADKVEVSRYDFTEMDKIMPHPVYAPQFFVCVLNPSDATWSHVQTLLSEAYTLFANRHSKRDKSQ